MPTEEFEKLVNSPTGRFASVTGNKELNCSSKSSLRRMEFELLSHRVEWVRLIVYSVVLLYK